MALASGKQVNFGSGEGESSAEQDDIWCEAMQKIMMFGMKPSYCNFLKHLMFRDLFLRPNV